MEVQIGAEIRRQSWPISKEMGQFAMKTYAKT
jgi:hypothetical protein